VSAFLLLWPALAFAQDAELQGVIKDQSGAIVPGASVTILAPTTGARRTITSDAAGRYVFSFLSPGDYDVTAELTGFQPVTRAGISLDSGSRITLDLTLRPARINETVAVAANGPVDESPGDATIIDREFLDNMAIDNRALQSVILLAPGIVGVGPSSDLQFSVDGNRTTSNAVTIDGVSANVAAPRSGGGQQVGAPFRQVITGDTDTNAAGANAMSLGGFTGGSDVVQLDAIEQVRVQTSAYSAQYGRQPGAQVQLVTRSGSNRFTASGFEYLRSSALDAHDYFSNANPQAQRGPYMQNQFGGVTGGPMLRDRLFYFFSYEGRVMGSPQPARQMRVPAADLRTDESVSMLLRRLMAAYPMPDGPEFFDSQGRRLGAAPFYDGSQSLQQSNSYSVKIDRNFGPRLLLTGRWNQGVSRRRSYSLAQLTTSGSDARTLTMNARSVLHARLLNELSGNYSRNASDNLSELTDRFGVTPLDVWDLVPSFAPAASSSTVSLPGSVQDYTLGPAIANRQVQAQIVDTMSWNTRRHEYRFGIDARRLTPVYGPTEYRSAVTFNLLTSLLSNRADQLMISSSDPVRLGIINFSAFAQDTLRMTNRLTFDYGMRWEVNPPPTGLNLPLYTLTGFPDLAALRLAAPGTPLYPTRWSKVAPRVGVAYRFRQAGQQVTLARSSFGLFYDLGTGATTTAARMFPYNRSVRRLNVPFPPDDARSAEAAPISLEPPYTNQDFTIVAPGNTLPRTWEWSASLEQSFSGAQRITATYTGHAGRQLLRRYFYAFDAVRPVNSAFPGARLNVTRNDRGWGDTSDYHALQVQYVRRLSRGLQALANYTLARATDSGSDDATVNLADNATRPTFYYGVSRFDRRHALNTSVTWNVPGPRRLRALLAGWGIDLNTRVQSAPPLTVTYNYTDPVDNINYNYRVDVIDGQPLWIKDGKAAGHRRLNPAAFALPSGAFGSRNEVTHGNEARNGLRGFGTWSADGALQKQFRIAASRSVQLRAEVHNVFNHPNFSQPDASIGTLIGATGQFIPGPLFGRITGTGGAFGGGPGGGASSTGGARTIQLALRFAY
jgi:carboxypeptidase family protein